MVGFPGHVLTVMVSSGRCIGHDDLHTTVGGVVRTLALFAVTMADIIGVLLLELG